MSTEFVDSAPPEIVQALGGRAPTKQQWDAISAPLEPCVVIAGAGSGKTAVMAARIVWLIVSGHAKATEILGLTFTNKAAANLLERVRTAIAPLGLAESEEPLIQTYHSFAASLIADYGMRVGLEPGAMLMTEAQAWQLCAEIFAERTYDDLVVRSMHHVSSVRHLAGECSDHLIDPQRVVEWDRDFLEKAAKTSKKPAGDVLDTSRRRIEMCGVVEIYQEVKRARHLLDYGDQIALACELAAEADVANDFRARFKFALLDEYQDTNHAQSVMLRRLMPEGFPVMSVGDPDQNIYAWRGASLTNLLQFAGMFPRADGVDAHTKPLVVNFRSGSRILSLANALIEGIPEARRPRDKVLLPHEPNGAGSVQVFLAPDQSGEAERIADEAIAANVAGTEWREIAVLARKKRLFGEILEAMRARDIPVEVIGLGGLLRMPEIVDLVSVLRVLADPMRNVSLARLLRGPRWRVGHRDLALIARHASARNRDLEANLEEEGPGDIAFSLAEALLAVDEVDGVSDDARARIAQFNAELSSLRRDTSVPLPELVRRALDVLGLERELDASPNRAAQAAKRNLANFLDRVAAFEPLEGEPTLSALIEYLDAIEDSDEEIEAAQPTDADSVKLMTIHQAKGLEFDVVFVPGLAAGRGAAKIFPDTARQANPATNPRYLPFDLRGDQSVLPDWEGNLAGFKRELQMRALEEERRLLYVAVTRARQRLVCSAAWWYYPSGWAEALKNPMGPSQFWEEIRAFADIEVLEEVEQPEENPLIGRRAARARTWPPPARRAPDPKFPKGLAAAVREARANTLPDETLFPLEPAVGLPPRRALPVSAFVTYAGCPKKFFWSYVRPLPRRPSHAARIGTIVHSWIEALGKGQVTLYDAEEFEERPALDDERLTALRGSFRASRFADVQPLYIERAFALVLGDFIVQGRIDAIFAGKDGGWEVVDWKTGRQPEEEGAEQWQLDLYALAAQEIWKRPADELTMTFVYLGDGTERSARARPAEEIRRELEVMLKAIAAEEFGARPGPACRYCDFLRDCEEGRAAVD